MSNCPLHSPVSPSHPLPLGHQATILSLKDRWARNLPTLESSSLYQRRIRNSYLTNIWGSIFFRASGYDSGICAVLSRSVVLVLCEVAQSCPTLCDPVDCSPPGSSVHGIFQARVLEWGAISFSRRSSPPRDRTRVSHIVDKTLYHLSHLFKLSWKVTWEKQKQAPPAPLQDLSEPWLCSCALRLFKRGTHRMPPCSWCLTSDVFFLRSISQSSCSARHSGKHCSDRITFRMSKFKSISENKSRQNIFL